MLSWPASLLASVTRVNHRTTGIWALHVLRSFNKTLAGIVIKSLCGASVFAEQEPKYFLAGIAPCCDSKVYNEESETTWYIQLMTTMTMTRRRRAESPPPTTTIGAANDDDSFRWWRSLAKQQQKWLWWYWTWWHWILILNTDVLPPSNDALRCWFDLCIWVHMVGLVCREYALLPPRDI